MHHLSRIARLAVGLAGIAGAVSLAAAPVTASADYNYTRHTYWNSAGYTEVDRHFWETPPGGVGWYSEVNWSSTVYTNYFSMTAQFYGQSNAYWWGSHPWCASDISLTDNWGAGGVAVSASIPIGAGFSGSATTVTWTTNNADCNAYENRVQHNYSDITINGFDLYTFDQQSCAVFTFSYSANNRCGYYSWDWIN